MGQDQKDALEVRGCSDLDIPATCQIMLNALGKEPSLGRRMTFAPLPTMAFCRLENEEVVFGALDVNGVAEHDGSSPRM